MLHLLADDHRVMTAVGAIGSWQKTVVDHTYTRTPDDPTQRLRDQQALASAALSSAVELARLIRRSADISEDVMTTIPTLPHPFADHEFNHPNWETDSWLHASLANAGCTRSHAMEFGWWHLLMLRQLEQGTTPDPPCFLLDRNAPGTLPFRRESLSLADQEMDATQHKQIDAAMRNLIRRSGGIWHRQSRFLLDAPMAAMWWRVELAKAASSELSNVSAEHIYECLLAAWSTWADDAARAASRLAHPRCVAAFGLAACRARQQAGQLPRGSAATRMTRALMRRTQHLSVPLVDPLHLERLIAS